MQEVAFDRWPVIVARFRRLGSEPAHVYALYGVIESALAREQRFALVLVDESKQSASGGSLLALGSEQVRWLRSRRTRTGTWCRGVAYVMPALREHDARRILEARRAWGCRVCATEQLDEALEWAREQVDGMRDAISEAAPPARPAR